MHIKKLFTQQTIQLHALLKGLYWTLLAVHFALSFTGITADITFYTAALTGVVYCFCVGRFRFNSTLVRLVLFAAVVSLSMAWSQNPDGYSTALTVIKFVIGAVVLYQLLEEEQDVFRFFNVLLISALFVLVYTVVTVGGIKGILELMEEGTRVGEEIGGINGLGQVLSLGFCLCLFRGMYKDKWKPVFYVLAVVFFFVAASTGSKRALFIMVLFLFAIVFMKNRRNFVKLLLITLAVIALVFVLMQLPFMEFLQSRLEELSQALEGTNTVDDATDAQRLKLLGYALEKFWESPLWGHGVDTIRLLNKQRFGIVQSAHNTYGDILANFGLLGAATFISIGISNAIVLIRRSRKYGPHIPELAVLLICLFLSEIFMTNMAAVSYQNSLLIYGLYVAVSRSNELLQKGENRL